MDRLKNHTVYCAGPIDEAPDFGVEWREDMRRFLWSLGLGVFSPTDKPGENSEDSVAVAKVRKMKAKGNWDKARKLMRKIISDDLHYVDLSNFVILYVDKDIHMCGSYIESSYSALEKKPVLVVCKQGVEEIPNSLLGICDPSLFFNSFDEVKDFLLKLDSGMLDHPKFRFVDYDKVFGRKDTATC